MICWRGMPTRLDSQCPTFGRHIASRLHHIGQKLLVLVAQLMGHLKAGMEFVAIVAATAIPGAIGRRGVSLAPMHREPLIQFRREGTNYPSRRGIWPPHGQAKLALPALHGADTFAKVRRYFLPGSQHFRLTGNSLHRVISPTRIIPRNFGVNNRCSDSENRCLRFPILTPIRTFPLPTRPT